MGKTAVGLMLSILKWTKVFLLYPNFVKLFKRSCKSRLVTLIKKANVELAEKKDYSKLYILINH